MNAFVLILVAVIGIILLVGGGITGYLLYMVLRSRHRAAVIRDTPLSVIDQLTDGYHKTKGKCVAFGKPLRSPLSRSDCVYYHFYVEEQHTRTVSTGPTGPNNYGGGTRTETYWVKVIDDKQAIDAGVEDKTGVAKLDLIDAEMVLSPSGHTQSGLFNEAPEHLKTTLARKYGYSTKGIFFNKTARYSETVIEEGNKLFVIGDVEVSRAGSARFVVGEQPFIVSDRNEAKVVGHYQTRTIWYSLGAVATGIFTLVIAAVPAFMLTAAAQFGNQVAAANPGAGPQPPGFADPRPQPPRGGANFPNPNNFPEPNRPGHPPNPRPNAPQHNDPPAGEPKHDAHGPASHYPGDVSWAMTVDPPTVPPVMTGPANPKAIIPVGGGGSARVLFPPSPSPFVALSPAGAGGQDPPVGMLLVYDLRTGKPVGRNFVVQAPFSEDPTLSGDGTRLAYRVDQAPQATVDVVSMTNGRSERKIVADSSPTRFIHPVEFLGKDKLLTMSHEGGHPDYGEETKYQVWDLTTGKTTTEFEFMGVFNRSWCGISPGGRYLLYQRSETLIGLRLFVFDLTTGKCVGNIEVQPKTDPFGFGVALVFSPDGKEFALLWRQVEGREQWGRIRVYDAATGTKLADHKLGFVLPRADSLMSQTGMKALQYKPDGSGWLFFGHVLIDRKSGAVVGKLAGKEPTWHAEMLPRRFVGPGFVTAADKGTFMKSFGYQAVPGGVGF